MKDSLLLLNRHVFKRVEIVASPTLDPEAINQLNVKLSCSQALKEPNRFLVGLDLKLLPIPNSGKMPPYTGELSIEGEFQIADEVPADRQQVTVIANGAGILFGAAREMLLNITARGPWPPLMLKTLNFIDMAKDMAAKTDARDSGLSSDQKAFSPVVQK